MICPILSGDKKSDQDSGKLTPGPEESQNKMPAQIIAGIKFFKLKIYLFADYMIRDA